MIQFYNLLLYCQNSSWLACKEIQCMFLSPRYNMKIAIPSDALLLSFSAMEVDYFATLLEKSKSLSQQNSQW
eukprot:c27426_g1_i1 orf=300-515(+)